MLPNTLPSHEKVRVVSTIYQNVSALNIVYMCVSQVSSLLKFPLPSPLSPLHTPSKFAIMHTSHITTTIMLMLSLCRRREAAAELLEGRRLGGGRG